MNDEQAIEYAHLLCKVRGIDPNAMVRIVTDEKSGNGYNTFNLALAVEYIKALNIGFSPNVKL